MEFLEAEVIEESTLRLGFSGLRDPGSLRPRPREQSMNNSKGSNIVRQERLKSLNSVHIGSSVYVYKGGYKWID